jgi:hypothetical protein
VRFRLRPQSRPPGERAGGVEQQSGFWRSKCGDSVSRDLVFLPDINGLFGITNPLRNSLESQKNRRIWAAALNG